MDWYTARIVAMLAAINSKHHHYRPQVYMLDADALRKRSETAAERPPMTGEQVVARFRAMGVPVIDLRERRN